jgi:coenzyme F420-reducing hydrogenase delta subunit/NAD-dependent dihydropyrimidine dehydrogenase PreA subunit
MSKDSRFTPKILGIICNWCCYGGADLCGVSRFQYPPYIRLIRVMCSGRVDLDHIFDAFLNGADGLFIGGCHLGDCHYITHGNYEALSMTRLAQKLLEHIGVNPRRLKIEWVSAGEGIRFANVMNEFSAEIEGLGPLGKGEGLDEKEVKTKLGEIVDLIPYIKIAKQEKLALHLLDDPTGYDTLYSDEEVSHLLDEAPLFEIDENKCKACMICLNKCPVDAIVGAKKEAHFILQDKCIKCGTCYAACPPRFGAVRKIVA